ncbi:hypothetical protein KGO5_06131 [Sinorhizobium sp. KGO-5]|jgi:hypothetical protein|nr:hypothetical protein KGO5_06131 [Sinorhizobium sp. KGO-5]
MHCRRLFLSPAVAVISQAEFDVGPAAASQLMVRPLQSVDVAGIAGYRREVNSRSLSWTGPPIAEIGGGERELSAGYACDRAGSHGATRIARQGLRLVTAFKVLPARLREDRSRMG